MLKHIILGFLRMLSDVKPYLKSNRADTKGSLPQALKQPDFFLLFRLVLLLKAEEKDTEDEYRVAEQELAEKMPRFWPALLYGSKVRPHY